MYGHSHNNDTYSFSPDFLAMSGSAPPCLPPHTTADYFNPPPPLVIPAYELDSLYDSPSYTATLTKDITRSGSSHSIATRFHTELLYSEGSSSTSMSRVFSAEDLQGTNMAHSHFRQSESPLSTESNSIIESMNRACRYSPDEKKERIERYRSKKTQRNFTKKIKYVCRKTLADSRPRIRGRFARNDDIQITEHQASQGGGYEGIDDEDDDNWMNNFLDSFPTNLIP